LDRVGWLFPLSPLYKYQGGESDKRGGKEKRKGGN